ncbi:Subtilisin-like protease, fibronectin type-III domain [Dillenia turbinata]|uniref:Subtilisin-like protease, fibronectin type-III domain n=1 Tax=Dillenia turbinata TaxID=194707 RepID=A0AAN8VZ79_9MAGN
MYPLTSGANAVNQTADVVAARMCDPGALDEKKVKGKIVLCEEGMDQDSTIKDLGGVGTLISTSETIDTGFTFLIPATYVSDGDAVNIETYINTTKRSRATIYKSKEFKVAAPFVASFSSRGPDTVSGAILKILTSLIPISLATARLSLKTHCSTSFEEAQHKLEVNAHSATKVKIKDEYAELASGTGQIAPVKAVDPGLVYDMSELDYVRFLCKQGYKGTSLRLVTDEYANCSSIPKFGGHDDLNYPSIYLSVEDSETPISALFHRRVTSVSPAKSVYKATVKAPKGLQVSVIPDTLVFDNVKEKRAFKVALKGPPMNGTTVLSATLEWSDSKHSVRSPILVLVPPPVPFIIF